jgi:hypothetical protein
MHPLLTPQAVLPYPHPMKILKKFTLTAQSRQASVKIIADISEQLSTQ